MIHMKAFLHTQVFFFCLNTRFSRKKENLINFDSNSTCFIDQIYSIKEEYSRYNF